ncbi:uncharacterized protein MCYG_07579 [Microsporum canis CBS 113480]|uniref:Uncharacterized protein n=1 Tax=Arthroderma otae (strain ATCC MYA-4605 / CBS 113480) TaxID=554155 RepID=C5FZ12_ARTOC|nr:uncharacterized protein MCYG_07579 [Microsporum canis CBS 113480]EEQ34760.1 predicted protein [Microsporum canis CBS 113480]
MGSRFEERFLSEYDCTTPTRYIHESESSNVSSRMFYRSPNLKAKQFLRDEEIDMFNARQLAKLLGIRAPGMKRTVETAENVFIVMERIYGQTLEEAGFTLGSLRLCDWPCNYGGLFTG